MKKNFIFSIQFAMGIAVSSLLSQATFASEGATVIKHSTATPAGCEVEISVKRR